MSEEKNPLDKIMELRGELSHLKHKLRDQTLTVDQTMHAHHEGIITRAEARVLLGVDETLQPDPHRSPDWRDWLAVGVWVTATVAFFVYMLVGR
jgi:hypothetical protein